MIRLSIVLTVLWAFASVFIALDQFSDAMKPYWGTADWKNVHSSLRTFYWLLAIVYWLAGTVLWWLFLYIGFWVARGFRRRQ